MFKKKNKDESFTCTINSNISTGISENKDIIVHYISCLKRKIKNMN